MKTPKIFLFVIYFFLSHGILFSQNQKKDTVEVMELISKAKRLQYTNTDSAIYYTTKATLLAEKINYSFGQGKADNIMGLFYNTKGNFTKARELHEKAKTHFEKINNPVEIGKCIFNIGFAYESEGNKEKALEFFEKAAKYALEKKDLDGYFYYSNSVGKLYTQLGNYEKGLSALLLALKSAQNTNDQINAAELLNSVASVLMNLKKYNDAIPYLEEGRKISLELKDSIQMSTFYNNLGISYTHINQTKKAEESYLKAIALSERNNDPVALAGLYINTGIFYLNSKTDHVNAEKYLNKAVQFSQSISDEEPLAYAYLALGSVLEKKGMNESSTEYLKKALEIAKKMNDFILISTAHKSMANNYSKQKKYKEAYDHFLSFSSWNDSLYNQKNTTLSSEMEAKYQNEKKAKDLIAKDAQLQTKHLEAEKSALQRNGFVIGFVLVLILAFFIFRSYRIKQRSNKELTSKNILIEKQKHLVEEHQKEIIDSITYAKRIQFTLLAHADLLQSNLPEHFVLFKQKDIVSGDFYWATKKDNRFYLAVCDSTGHGVPGAFMSLLNITFLNEAVNEKNIVKPNMILDHVRTRLIENISKEGAQDGMDAILICMEFPSPLERDGRVRLTYAAANNAPLVIINNRLESLDADKMPVGKGEKTEPFTLRTIDAQKGDTIYLYTDGYADQFGGPKGKKFKYKTLNDLLLNNYTKPAHDQKEILTRAFEDWKGNLEQVDGVCLIGIRI